MKKSVHSETKPVASLSMDIDNLWCYLKTQGEEWQSFVSYYPIVIPKILALLKEFQAEITFFVIGQDAAMESNKKWLQLIAQDAHEFGNHSFHHDPTIQFLPETEILAELQQADEAIYNATGQKPRGYRGPCFGFTKPLLKAIRQMNYDYDSSLCPTILSPMLRVYYSLTNKSFKSLDKKSKDALTGKLSNGFRPIHPFYWKIDDEQVLEIPVSTLPFVRTPIHFTYLLWLAEFSPKLSLQYLKTSLKLLRAFQINPSFLLHPPDLLTRDEVPQMKHFPGMTLSSQKKSTIIRGILEEITNHFELKPLSKYIHGLNNSKSLIKI